MTHRCAVCWEQFPGHASWYQHCIKKHDAVLDEFGFDRCKQDPRDCVGVRPRLRSEGVVTRRKRRPTPLVHVAPDGTKYIQAEMEA